MKLSLRANVLLLVFCLAVGVATGITFAEWLDPDDRGPGELLSLGLFYVGVGGGVGCYFVCIDAVRRMSGRADRQGPEADYGDPPPAAG